MSTHPERDAVHAAAQAYFHAHHRPNAFVPGETYLPATAKQLDASDLTALIDASLDMWLTAGRFAHALEEVLPKYFARRCKALLVNSGSSANLLAISALTLPTVADVQPLQPGDEVITAAVGFPTTINPILQNRLVPVLVDVDPNSLNASSEAVINAVTPRTRAVVLAHTLGNPFRADVLGPWCAERGIRLVEDCCDALGASVGGQPAGSWGDYATLSFYPAHHITMGEGGAVIAKNAAWRRPAESLRDWGRDCWCNPGKDNTCGKRFAWQLGDLPAGYDHKYVYTHQGYNLKVTDMQAAIGLSQLSKVETFIAARRTNWQRLYDGVQASPRLRRCLVPVQPQANSEPSWFGFAMHCQSGVQRHALTQALEAAHVGTRLVFAGNVTKQPAYQNAPFVVPGPLPGADAIMHHTFWIGVHPSLTDAALTYMLEQLEAGVRAQGLLPMV